MKACRQAPTGTNDRARRQTMCGIAGIVHTDGKPVDSRTLEAMTLSIKHRGPDGQGTIIKGQLGFGHRRLSIIDLATGAQPMCNEDGSVWITFNGEIYNFMELRDFLINRGHQFKTHCDTESIIHAYEEWGDDCVTKFRGMFAFGITDLKKHRLFLARDHLGIKPLYFTRQNKTIAFASELQALRQVPNLKFSMDINSVDKYLLLQYIPAPSTIYTNVQKLPPASCISFDFNGETRGIREYWRFSFQPDNTRTEQDWLADMDTALRDSVKDHLVSDVPFGAFLSGGVDSSATVAYMAQIMDKPVKTFSIGFEESEYDELSYAKQVANRWQTEHHVEIVKPDAAAILPDLVSHYGEPFADSSAIPTYYVCKMARKHVPMVLSGDGGDEIFAGYRTYQGWMASTENAENNWLLNRWINNHVGQIRQNDRDRLWQFGLRPSGGLQVLQNAFRGALDYGFSQIAQHLDINIYLPGSILAKVDIASMMHGLEVRTPLVDVRFFEFAARIPQKFNLALNSDSEWEGKLLLKKLLLKFYPSDFVHRPKMGFSVPMEKWFGVNGKLGYLVKDKILAADSPLNTIFDRKHLSAFANNISGNTIWILIFLDEWMRQNGNAIAVSKQKTKEPLTLVDQLRAQDLGSDVLNKKLFIKSFVRQRFAYLLEKHKNIILFPAGKHSRWVLKVINGLSKDLKRRIILTDDSIVKKSRRDGFQYLPVSDALKSKFDVVLLSTDCHAPKIKARCRRLFGKKVALIYEGLPPGPYCEKD